MIRLRLALAASVAGVSLLAGCSSMGNGPIMSRFNRNRGVEVPCDSPGGCPTCGDGPMLGDPTMVGPAMPPPPPSMLTAPRPLPADGFAPNSPAPPEASPQSRVKRAILGD
jgi:hypothetical protein